MFLRPALGAVLLLPLAACNCGQLAQAGDGGFDAPVGTKQCVSELDCPPDQPAAGS